ncbi:hypothetical protein HanRHA438_Chr03g0098691 [Helianthus annuus]|uniref:Uncharacterized protein n=1 Tax=Helianthus annuus TaxID=4232 RepID=A0A9K3JBL0_HELAN|nr:hypothetical protein HanXRQr2_Chr03g0087461 [Helianthus annuus]KAJ0495694.1 hypothetical protein HanIR_Chr12g0611771 [Helianthus annuus]KAJ0733683.1 hypothetical protein HanPI659440_Chr11g0411061 [Helianthus annuus]KAJ0933661.1 hypothetical protein HanRHA438_Chr03g0098691 [Helianthus annuus]
MYVSAIRTQISISYGYKEDKRETRVKGKKGPAANLYAEARWQ